MIFVILCKDKAGGLDTRMATRPQHLDWLNGLNAEGRIKFAGAFQGEDGKPNGSMIALEADSAEAAKAIADADPYAHAGLFESVEIRPWTWAINNPENA